MPKMKSPIERITVEMTTLEAVLKGDGAPTGCSMVLDLLYQALEENKPVIVVQDKRTGRRYTLTEKGLIEFKHE
jgi:hypothetical protein